MVFSFKLMQFHCQAGVSITWCFVRDSVQVLVFVKSLGSGFLTLLGWSSEHNDSFPALLNLIPVPGAIHFLLVDFFL